MSSRCCCCCCSVEKGEKKEEKKDKKDDRKKENKGENKEEKKEEKKGEKKKNGAKKGKKKGEKKGEKKQDAQQKTKTSSRKKGKGKAGVCPRVLIKGPDLITSVTDTEDAEPLFHQDYHPTVYRQAWREWGARGAVVWTIGNGTPAVAAIMEEIPQIGVALNEHHASVATYLTDCAVANAVQVEGSAKSINRLYDPLLKRKVQQAFAGKDDSDSDGAATRKKSKNEKKKKDEKNKKNGKSEASDGDGDTDDEDDIDGTSSEDGSETSSSD